MKVVKSGIDNSALVVQAAANVTAIESLSWIDPDTIADVQNRPEELPLGLINFKLSVNTPGATAGVVIYFSQAAPADAQWVQYNPQTGWQDYSAHAVFSADGKSVALAFTDGGFGDADGAANGVIVDPSGIGTTALTPDTTNPSVTINSPTTNPTFSTSSSSLSISGSASDNVGVTQVTWSNNRGGGGSSTGTTSWTKTGITLSSGQNVITVTARDAAGNTAIDTLTVTYTPPGGPATDPPGVPADPGTATASGGGGGGGCLISTAASGFPTSNGLLGIVVFFGSLLIGLIRIRQEE